MDRERLIIIRGEDKTGQIVSADFNSATQRYDVCFSGSTIVYHYAPYSVMILECPQWIDAESVEITCRGNKLFAIESIQRFCDVDDVEFWHISFQNGSEHTYDIHDLDISFSCLIEPRSADVLGYLRELSRVNELKSPDGEILLEKQYNKLAFVGDDTTLAVYLNPEEYRIRRYETQDTIFPFGGNASQFQALENALNNQISIIQGPPGTGKTQTILNIIANLLMKNKTVQVVSSNNSATLNVMEKLASPQYALDFLVAPLGSFDNKKAFLANQPAYPSFSGWEKSLEERDAIKHDIAALSQSLHQLFEKQERLAAARLELDSLRTEVRYFKQYCEDRQLSCDGVKNRRALSSSKLMKLWRECETYSEKERVVSFWFKIKCAYIYGISNWAFYSSDISKIVTLLQHLFCQARINELSGEIAALEAELRDEKAQDKLDRLVAWSMEYLRAELYERYGERENRRQLTDEDFWKNPQNVLDEYPVTLSSTFASRSSLRGMTYDYIIMDEASQVDLATGALALSGARNAVIVGDVKQLPNVVKPKTRALCDEIFARYQLPDGYSFTKNSFLKSICTILPDAPQTLLREHYRCHPKIIGFCNQKFYHDELVIMTEDQGEVDTLAVYQANAGNHRRGHLNQRQIDVTLKDVFPAFADVSPEKIGIIAPYRDQVSAITAQIETQSRIEVDTVHKFQGREKDAIILTTVDDVVTDFSDDPYLLNVAISRAKKRLALVVSRKQTAYGQQYQGFDFLYQI